MDRSVKIPCEDAIDTEINLFCGDYDESKEQVSYCKHCVDKISMAKSMDLMNEKLNSMGLEVKSLKDEIRRLELTVSY